MKPRHFTVVALTSSLFGAAIWSCNKDKTLTESTEARSVQERQSPPAIPSGTPGNAGGTMDQLRAGCPMVVQGAEVTVTDTEGGVALAFTTDAADVADLRTRVRRMAQMYEMHRGRAGMMWHQMGGDGMGHGDPGMGGKGKGMRDMAGRGPMPAASIELTNTDLGARLELRPTAPSRLDALRQHVRWHQERMDSGECWMLEGQPTATPRGEQE